MAFFSSNKEKEEQAYQNVVVMRHGPRLDNFDPNWVPNTECPWNPPLYDGDEYKELYSETAKKIREEIGAPIHRVFVSPFLRCLQTASRTMEALASERAAGHPQIKAQVELGLAEMMNGKAIWHPPKDGDFKIDVSECESHLPVGTFFPQSHAERVFHKLPEWGESEEGSLERFMNVIQTLADKYPSDNLLLVTHGAGVEAASRAFHEGNKVRIEYCAYARLRRLISSDNNSNVPLKLETYSGISLRNGTPHP